MKYLFLTKPGILFGNAMTFAGGFFLASQGGTFYFSLFLPSLLGLCCVMASACVFNNLLDSAFDAKMRRTQKRALVTGAIAPIHAIQFGTVLIMVGLLLLTLYTNYFTVTIAATGFLIYVFAYSFAKRHTSYATAIGSLAGSVPPLVGFCANGHYLNTEALVLFMIVSLWQMPHFFAIAVYHLDDYRAASLPVLPVTQGVATTKYSILGYVIAFALSLMLLYLFGYTGISYLIVMLTIGVSWCILGIKGIKTQNDRMWAQKMFRFSLIAITGFCLMVSLERYL